MLFDRIPIVRADVDIDADDLALADQLQHRGHEDHRTAAGDARFDDDVRLGVPDHFLGRHDIGRHLDDRHAHERPEIGIVVFVERHQCLERLAKGVLVLAERERHFLLVSLECETIVCCCHNCYPLFGYAAGHDSRSCSLVDS
ncbi:hypothetical protein D9M72_458270 [compost metagenome]